MTDRNRETDMSFFALRDDVVHLTGEFDIANADLLETLLLNCETAPLQIDMSQVHFLDSFALRALVRVAGMRPDLQIVNPSTFAARVLEITGLADYFRMPRARSLEE